MCRKLSLIAVVIMLATVSLMAQAMKSDPKERAAAIKTKLSLTEDQTAKVERIFTASDAKIAAVKMEKGTAKESVKKIKAETDKEIENVLTDAQKIEYKKLIAMQTEKHINTAKAEKTGKTHKMTSSGK